MDLAEKRARAEQELRFMRESLDAGVISQEEFSKAERRIRQHIRKLEEQAVQEPSVSESPSPEPSANQSDQPDEPVTEEKAERPKRIARRREIVEEKSPSAEAIVEAAAAEENLGEMDEAAQEGISNESYIQDDEVPAKESSRSIGIPSRKEEREEKPMARPRARKEKKVSFDEQTVLQEPAAGGVSWKLAIVTIVVAGLFVAFFYARAAWNQPRPEPMKESSPLLLMECKSDSDCGADGKIGVCRDGGCLYGGETSPALTVVNDGSCLWCSSERMVTTLLEIFPGISVEHVDIKESDKGALLAEEFKLQTLPAYILNASIAKAPGFSGFQRALLAAGSGYVVNGRASGAPYFYKNPAKPSRLDVFYSPETEQSILGVLESFSKTFGESVRIEKHLAERGKKGALAESFWVSSYPSYVVNNQMKFSGILTPELLRERFCVMNQLEQCKA
ncbi:hypothetical protein HYU13_03025 [Candidatus Woesearchaeota archaeon]|nr:hypothetical protein [Candidatus Woesearchaeota archaeon]